MRRKLFGVIGGAIALAGAVGGAFTAERKRRDARFYRDLMMDLQVAAGVFRGRRDAAQTSEITAEAARDLLCEHEEFDVVEGGLRVEVDAGLPDNTDVTRMKVVLCGTENTLFILHKRLMADDNPRLGIEDVTAIDHQPGGPTISFTLLVPGIGAVEAAALQQKLDSSE